MPYQIHHRPASGLRRWRRARSPKTPMTGQDADVARDLGQVVGAEDSAAGNEPLAPSSSGSRPSRVSDLFIEPEAKYW